MNSPLPEPKRDPEAKPPANARPKAALSERLNKLVANLVSTAQPITELF